ncbi:MAG: hypothetical protein ACR2NR_10335 [Solirubrobacteraceae bacterium]
MAKGSESEAEVLRRLEQRLDRAAEAAERLLADAVAAGLGNSGPAEGADRTPPADGPAPPPPAGWQQREPDRDARHRGGEVEFLFSVLTAVRDRIPPELQQRLAEAIRDVLLAIRALIDWYLEREQPRRNEPARVQDIPIL